MSASCILRNFALGDEEKCFVTISISTLWDCAGMSQSADWETFTLYWICFNILSFFPLVSVQLANFSLQLFYCPTTSKGMNVQLDQKLFSFFLEMVCAYKCKCATLFVCTVTRSNGISHTRPQLRKFGKVLKHRDLMEREKTYRQPWSW